MSNQMKKTTPIHTGALRELKKHVQECLDVTYYDGRHLEFKGVDRPIEAYEKMENILNSSYFELSDIYLYQAR